MQECVWTDSYKVKPCKESLMQVAERMIQVFLLGQLSGYCSNLDLAARTCVPHVKMTITFAVHLLKAHLLIEAAAHIVFFFWCCTVYKFSYLLAYLLTFLLTYLVTYP